MTTGGRPFYVDLLLREQAPPARPGGPPLLDKAIAARLAAIANTGAAKKAA